MSLLYRTPNIVIDEFEFHMSVELRDGRVAKHLRWRPLAEPRRTPWASIATFKGHPPKPTVMKAKFDRFKRHVAEAERSVVENRLAAQRLSHAA